MEPNLKYLTTDILPNYQLRRSVVYSSSYDLSNPAHFEEIGNCDEIFYLGNKKVFALRAPFRQTEQTFVFPHDPEKSNFMIRGIQHHDYLINPSKLTIKKGGIGEKFVVISIKSHPGSGISSVVRFYGTETTNSTYL